MQTRSLPWSQLPEGGSKAAGPLSLSEAFAEGTRLSISEPSAVGVGLESAVVWTESAAGVVAITGALM